MEAYELVEAFEASWDRALKGIPLGMRDGKKFVFSLFLSARPLRIYVSLTVGPQGGIKEEVVVIDPSPTVTADRLVVHSTDGGDVNRGLLLPLSDLRREVLQLPRSQRYERALTVCREALWDYVEQLDDAPLRPERLRLLPSTSRSVSVIYAGSPSLGKRGGGVSGKS